MNCRLLLALAAFGLFGFALRGAGPTTAKPNIVYFLIDDMGYADVGFNGCTDFKTPNFDKFARQGTVLECLYGQPVCSPTRAALLTGRYPTRTGVYNVVEYRAFPQPLPLNERTLAQTLQSAGYTTAISGKWHLGADAPDHRPTRRGFDHQYGFMSGSINSFTHFEGGRREAKGADWYLGPLRRLRAEDYSRTPLAGERGGRSKETGSSFSGAG